VEHVETPKDPKYTEIVVWVLGRGRGGGVGNQNCKKEELIQILLLKKTI
jgi:hypothetical protein